MLLLLASWNIISPSFYLWFSSNVCGLSLVSFVHTSRPLNNSVHQSLAPNLLLHSQQSLLRTSHSFHSLSFIPYAKSQTITDIHHYLKPHFSEWKTQYPTVICYIHEEVFKTLWSSHTQKWTDDLLPQKWTAKWCSSWCFFSIP